MTRCRQLGGGGAVELRTTSSVAMHPRLRTENMDGVWESALANMELYLSLRDKARAFRADPEVQEAMEAGRFAELSQPTLGEGETYTELLADRSAFEDFDLDRARTQGYSFASHSPAGQRSPWRSGRSPGQSSGSPPPPPSRSRALRSAPRGRRHGR